MKELNKIEGEYKLEEIIGVIYGAFSTRFWMMRTGINEIIIDNYQENLKIKSLHRMHKQRTKLKSLNVPFHAWECISIVTKKRQTDIVIRDERHMRILLDLLIMKSTKTKLYNGKPLTDSAYDLQMIKNM